MTAFGLSRAPGSAALFTDLYELTMAESYLEQGMQHEAVFELFFRELPQTRNFIVAAGLEPLLAALENFEFTNEDVEYLRGLRKFSEGFLQQLSSFRFTGDVYAVPEGTVVFPQEPLVQVVAPLPQAQIIETLVLNQLHFASLAASKAARIVLAARGRRVIDFGSRRAHGTDAALIVARASYLAGMDGTSLVEAGRQFGIPLVGTMAHSYIQAHNEERAAFAAFLASFPEATLLVDTYDTLRGVELIIELQRQLDEEFHVQAIRLDSGDLTKLANESRRMLDGAGLENVRIVASGGLDEFQIENFVATEVPIDGFGVGTTLAVSADAPSLDMVYKLVEYNGKPRTKLSSSKVLFPGPKQVYRWLQGDSLDHDVLARADAALRGTPLLQLVMRKGQRLEAYRVTLEQSRQYAQHQLQSLPEGLRMLSKARHPYPVQIDPGLNQELERLRNQFHQS